MPTTERIFKNRGIVARGNTLTPDEITFLSYDKSEKILNPRRMELIVKKAESYLEHEIKVIPLSSYRRYYVDGNRYEMQSYYTPRRDALVYLALAEMYERQGRFTNKLIDFIWAILEESTWLISAHFRCAVGCEDGVPNYFGDIRLHDIALYAAATGALLAFVYRYCADILDGVSPIIRERIKYEVNIRITKPYLAKNYVWMGYSGPHRTNWLTWITSNVLFSTAVFCDDRAIRERIVQRAMDSLDTFLESYNFDGGCDEGAFYWTAAAGSLLDCLDTLYDISGGKIDIYDHPLIKAMGEYLVDFTIFDTNIVNFADAPCKVSTNAALVRRYGEATGSEIMTAYARLLNKGSGCEMELGHAYRVLRSAYDPDACDIGVLPAKTAVYYDCIKVALFRESDIRGEGYFLAIKGGNNKENHNHNDVGGFMLYRDKTPIIVDPGFGEYINWAFASREKCWYKDSDFHSIPTFDGVMQMFGAEFKSKNELFSQSEKSFVLDITESYPKEAGLKAYTRRAEIKDGAVLITDNISLDREREIDFVFTSPTEPKIDGDSFIMNGGARLSLDTAAELSVEAHDTEYAGCKSWGKVIYRAHFKLKSAGGSFKFTVK